MCRSPHGERGLKSVGSVADFMGIKSLPTRGAWIEIKTATKHATTMLASLPTRGAWIEICSFAGSRESKFKVAPHTGSVD